MNRIKGLDKLLNKLDTLDKKSSNELDSIIEATAYDIQLDATQKAPVNLGKLRQSIYTRKVQDKKYQVIVGLDYGVYVEFGTGGRVKVPAEFAQMASKFKGKGGSFDEGLQSIRDWCRSKGIPESNAYVIFMSILKNGLRPQPYLYPAFVKGRIQMLEDLQEMLKKLV